MTTTPTASPELLDMDRLEALAIASAQHGDDIGEDEWYSADKNMSLFSGSADLDLIAACSPVAILSLIALARRAQQAAAPCALDGWNAAAKTLAERAAGHFLNKDFELQDECLQCASMLHDLKPARDATSAPGTPEAPKPPFPISDDEMAALRRFWECATDGEGYDVEKPMMQRLAEMGLVQRKSGAYYMSTDFGLYVLGEYTVQRAAQLDGGQGEGQ